MSSKKLAKFLAIALGPHIWPPILLILIIFKSGLTPNQTKVILPAVLLLQVILPITYLIVAPKLGWVGQWDMKKKKERKPFFILMFFLTALTLFIIHNFGNELLFNLNIIFIALLIVLFTITNYWRISLHTSLNTAAAIVINFLFNWEIPMLYLLIPIVFWARFKLKKHTKEQLLAGIIVSILISFGGLLFFGYL